MERRKVTHALSEQDRQARHNTFNIGGIGLTQSFLILLHVRWSIAALASSAVAGHWRLPLASLEYASECACLCVVFLSWPVRCGAAGTVVQCAQRRAAHAEQ